MLMTSVLRKPIMITVTIFVGEVPLYTRTARNTGRENDRGHKAYELDTGDILFHKPEAGAVVLAKKMLDTVVEKRPE